MKSAGIITFLHNDNYGSSLQAYALQTVIRSLGYTCEHLDYRPDTKEKILNMLKSGNHPKLIMEGLRKKQVKAGQSGARTKAGSFSDFYQKRMQLSKPCRNRRELAAASGKMDILVCGSDQIWSPVWLNPVYFLNFAHQGQKKIAYAPSIGVATIEQRNKRKTIGKLVRTFDAVSLREQEGAEVIQRITGMETTVNPDPVCLLSADEWRELAEAVHRAPYILCYFIGQSEEYWKRVAELKQETGLEVLVLPVTSESYMQPYEKMDGASPEQFLGCISEAALVCTDSFHCTVFATIFGTGTEVFRRYSEEDPESKNSRIDQWIRLTGSAKGEARQQVLEKLQAQGKNWLRKALQG